MIKRRLFYTVIVSIAIVIVLVLLKQTISESMKDTIDDITSWFSFIVDVITLIIALVLLEKFGLDKRINERRQDVMIELMDKLSEKSVTIEAKSHSGNLHVNSFNLFSDEVIPIVKLSDLGFQDHSIKNKKLIFDRNYPEAIEEIGKYSSNFWIPKDIKKKISDACMYIITFDDKLNPNDPNYIKVRFSLGYDSIPADKDIKYGTSAVNADLIQYINNWINLRTAIMNWLKNNTEFSSEVFNESEL
jgi:hypothetical protein